MRVKRQAAEIEGILRDIQSQLDNEAEQDREYRAQHKGAWTAVASEQLTREMRMDHSNYSKLLRQASESDALVRQLLNANRQSIQSQLVDKPRPASPGCAYATDESPGGRSVAQCATSSLSCFVS